jgi:hypothetical protein
MKTVVGLYEDITDAQATINDLVRSGFERGNISLVTTNRWAEEMDLGGDGTIADSDVPLGEDQLGSDVAAGVLTGGAVGGLAGVLLGLGALAIPGLGPIIAAGPLVAGLAGAGMGAAVGGLVGALVNWGVPQEEAEVYAESVRRGGILVGLKTDEANTARAVEIMNRHDPIDVERQSEQWRASGWTGYDASSAGWKEGQAIEGEMNQAPSVGWTEGQTTEGEMSQASSVGWAEGQAQEGALNQVPSAGWTEGQTNEVEMNQSDYLDYATYTPAFREHFAVTYGNGGRDYIWYDPAYRYGYNLGNDQRYRIYDTWDELEAEARSGWAKTEFAAERTWDAVKAAVRQGWEQVKDALDFDSDYADFEPGFREHYQTRFGASGREYDWYSPGYRYGFDMAMDERWDEFDTWDEVEAEARAGWEKTENTAGRAWDDLKDAVRQGWEEVRDALDLEADYADRESDFMEHYETQYRGLNRHEYDWYEPAYRFGYVSGLDERYDDYDAWDDAIEADIRREWESSDFVGDSVWDDIKDAVRRGWESVREAFEFDDDEEAISKPGVGGYTSHR